MRQNPHILYFGEGTAERGGTFAHTKGLWQEFGGARMVDTPISEQGFAGSAIGASATGTRVIADLMFADFMFEAAGQIVLQAAKLHYMSNGQMNAPVVFRVGSGALRSAGPHHSGCYHPMWAHIPGLIVCMPSNPADAKGLMKTALRGSNPVIILETKALFASKGEVPVGEHFVPFGVAEIVRLGTDITIVSAGQLVHRTLEAADTLSHEGIACEVIDIRTLMPLDVATIADSVRKTHRLLVVDEGYAMCGIGAEIAQAMNELVYDELDGPIGRLHTDALTHPFAPALERAMLVDAPRIAAAVHDVIEGNAPVSDHWRSTAAGVARPMRTHPRAVETPGPAHPSEAPRPKIPLPVDGEPITMPFGDLTVSEGKIVRWAKPEGASFNQGELIAEIETEKAVVEIEAPCAGVLAVIEHPAGTVVKMGERIGLIRQV
jgi:2-oxoisovalerate dehydrogenase E1 component